MYGNGIVLRKRQTLLMISYDLFKNTSQEPSIFATTTNIDRQFIRGTTTLYHNKKSSLVHNECYQTPTPYCSSSIVSCELFST